MEYLIEKNHFLKDDNKEDDLDDFLLSRVNIPTESFPPKTPRDLPPELLKSQTIEDLISQNQDLMDRLALFTRKMAQLENENQKIFEEHRQTQLTFKGLREQIQLLKEKESHWKQKEDSFETEIQISAEKNRTFQEQITDLQNKLLRHEKYHEKVKTEVQPYIENLKSLSQQLEIKSQEQEKEIQLKESQLQDLRNQLRELLEHKSSEEHALKKLHRESIQFYEEQLEKINQNLKRLEHIEKESDLKGMKLKKALENQDYLENELIQLKRLKEELKERLESELQVKETSYAQTLLQNKKLGVEHADLQSKVLTLEALQQKSSVEQMTLNEQLESVRVLWTSKNEENEKLKLALYSLEKINADLSAQLNSERSSAT